MNDNESKPSPGSGDASAEPAPAAAPNEGVSADLGQRSEEAGWEEAVEGFPTSPPGDVERLEAEKADLTERLVRLAADMENLRKRAERDAGDARKYAVTKFAGDMLVVADSLRRALEAVPAEQREAGDEALKALLEGVEMTAREMDRLLERHGVTRIASKGERFDPHRHQAMYEVPDPNAAPGTIVEVVQDGYQIGDRVLRAALVGVAKQAPSSEAAGQQSPAA
jgi:molecular chaperone GrpE